MDGKVNRRVDCLVHLLLNYEVDLFFNKQTKDLMWKHNRKEARENQRHQHGIKINDEDFEVCHDSLFSDIKATQYILWLHAQL